MIEGPVEHEITRREIAQAVYSDFKTAERAAFDVAAGYGRWLIGSLVVIHGGALFGLFQFLQEASARQQLMQQYAAGVWWFVAGLLLALICGFLAWLNWSMHSENYRRMVSTRMLWDPSHWVQDPHFTTALTVTNHGAIILGFLSASCIFGGADAIVNGSSLINGLVKLPGTLISFF